MIIVPNPSASEHPGGELSVTDDACWPGAYTVNFPRDMAVRYGLWPSIQDAGHVVYVALGDQGVVLYVGQTRKPRERLKDHDKASWWRGEVRRVVVLPVADEAEARIAEHLLTARLTPRENRIQVGRNLGRLRSLLVVEHEQLVG